MKYFIMAQFFKTFQPI